MKGCHSLWQIHIFGFTRKDNKDRGNSTISMISTFRFAFDVVVPESKYENV